MLEQWERDNLDFDFRRYRHDARSGGPFGSLRIAGRGFHPHEITIPAEEVDHWLASQASAQDAGRSREPLPPGGGEVQEAAQTALGGREEPRKDHRADDARPIEDLAAWFAGSGECLSSTALRTRDYGSCQGQISRRTHYAADDPRPAKGSGRQSATAGQEAGQELC